MKVIDLTHVISEDMPVYPGTEPPKLKVANTLEADGFKETLMTMYSHTGTHMDPPAHIYADGKTLDQMDISQFVGKAIVIDCTDLTEDDCKIDMSYINKNRDKVDKAEFVLFNTGWNKKWGTMDYFGKFPVADPEVIEYLTTSRKKGFGVDVISIEPIADEDLPVHNIVLKNEMVIIENLMNLELLGDDLVTVCLLPLKYKDADGSPIRAVALLED